MRNFLFTYAVFVFFLTGTAFAQTVTSIKDKKVLLDMGGETWSIGDKVFAVDGNGKRKGLMQIKQVKGTRAVAELLKGAANPGMALLVATKSAPRGDSGSSVVSRGARTGSAFGYTAALMMNSMKISNFDSTVYGTKSFEMTGTNFGAGVFYDYPLTPSWFARGHGTFEMFDVVKKASEPFCKGNTSADCNATFMQTGFYGTFNYSLSPSPRRFWVGGGGGAVIYLSKESTVLETSQFFFNTILMVAAGYDYFTSRNTFIPIAFEYQMIPDKEAAVTTMVLRAGWGKTF